jgi:hypothetical protein
MKNKGWLWLIFAAGVGGCTCLVLCLGALVVSPYLERILDSQVIQTGMPAPDFTVPGLGGGQVQLSKYAGKPVLLTVGATW